MSGQVKDWRDLTQSVPPMVNGSWIPLVRMKALPGHAKLPIPAQLQAIEAMGATAVLLETDTPESHTAIAKGGIDGPLSIPVVCLSAADAAAIGAAAIGPRPLGATVHTSGHSAPAKCANLIVDLAPNSNGHADELVVLGAHLDSFYLNPGAFDNLSGVLCIMAILRTLARAGFNRRRRLRLIFFSAEETGFLGSKAHVASPLAELDNIRFFCNFDCVYPLTANGVAVMGSQRWHKKIEEVAATVEPTFDIRSTFCQTSDYLPFMLAGIPCGRPVDWSDTFPEWIHTRLDQPGAYPLEWITENVATHATWIAKLLADPDPLPYDRQSLDDVRQMVEENGALNSLRSYGFVI